MPIVIHMFACHTCDTHGYTDVKVPKGWVQDTETQHWFCCETHYEMWKLDRDTMPAPAYSVPEDEVTRPDYPAQPKDKPEDKPSR